MVPCFRPISNLVYAATPDVVDTVMIHGEIVMRRRELVTMDEKEVLAKAGEAALALARRSGLA